MSKKIFCIISIAWVIMLTAGCTSVRNIVEKYESEPKATVKTTSESEYTYLNNQEEILEYLLAAARENKGTCYFNVASQELIDGNVWMAKLDGIHNISLEYSKAKEGYNVCVSIEYWDNYPILAAYKKNDTTILTPRQVALFQKYTEIIGTYVKPTMTAYEKELALHDYLVEHIVYDENNTEGDCHTAYGALVNGTAVCDGYAECFQTLMEMVGIQCRRVTGTANQTPHSWNMVMLDGAWYHVDVTWDDPIGNNNIISHKYFNVTDAELSTNHSWERKDYPMAVGVQYAYFLMSGVYQSHSQEEFENYVARCIKQLRNKIEIVAYGNVDLEAALKKSEMSFRYSYDIINKGAYKIYEIYVEY